MDTLDVIVPVLMGVALLWWIGRNMSRQAMLLATALTLAVIVAVMAAQTMTGR